jgi:hypothetical protein
MSRSTYIAASTIAPATITLQPQPWAYTPVRIRNSPAKVTEPGTASATIPSVISAVASAGRPFAIPPSRTSSPVVVRRSTVAASRNIPPETSAWATDCRIAPAIPASLAAKRPMVMSPICASEE